MQKKHQLFLRVRGQNLKKQPTFGRGQGQVQRPGQQGLSKGRPFQKTIFMLGKNSRLVWHYQVERRPYH